MLASHRPRKSCPHRRSIIHYLLHFQFALLFSISTSSALYLFLCGGIDAPTSAKKFVGKVVAQSNGMRKTHFIDGICAKFHFSKLFNVYLFEIKNTRKPSVKRSEEKRQRKKDGRKDYSRCVYEQFPHSAAGPSALYFACLALYSCPMRIDAFHITKLHIELKYRTWHKPYDRFHVRCTHYRFDNKRLNQVKYK